MARRVVVTGIGLICAVGHTSTEVWQNIIAGKSGVTKITTFDTTQFACQIAAAVKGFDPLNFIEKKEVKKMGRFIHFAMAAADEAMKMSALQVEAAITPMGVGGFAAMRALSTRNDDPETASRPWDSDRDGFVIGEGAGILVLEDLEFARKRGAKILSEIIGYGMSADAYHITQPAEEGEGGWRVMTTAINDAKLSPADIDYVNAHGTSTPIGDVLETKAIKRTFGADTKIAVSSTKSMTGHLLGGAGGLEAGITILALRDQTLPPTINLNTPDPECDLDYVPNVARKAPLNVALSNSFGFGGTNGSLIFKRWTE